VRRSFRGHPRVLFATAFTAVAAILAVGPLGSAAGAAVHPATTVPTAAPVSTGPISASLPVFRVDVSRYPRIGLVVTVPGSPQNLAGRDFMVFAGDSRAQEPGVRKLSPDDIELMLAPDARGSLARLRRQYTAAARFLAGLPAGSRTGVADPARPGIVAVRLSTDPARSVTDVAEPVKVAVPLTAATRLAASLSTFTRGSRVRRTVVLAITADEPLARPAAARFGQQLAASGTALYVLDAAPHGVPAYDALAAASGGEAIRVNRASGWSTAFSRITDDLGRQYYLRFTDRVALPDRVVIAVRTPTGVVQGAAGLPAVNPLAPAPLRVFIPAAPHSWDSPFVWLAAMLVVLGVGYGLGMLTVSRREPRQRGARRRGVARSAAPPVTADQLFYVFLMPCLNEEKVLPNSLRRLLSIPRDNFVVMVVDDGSDDHTVEAISGLLGERVWLLSRKAPNARQGKGEALNAAIRYLTSSGLLDGHDPDHVITVVVDADGRLDHDAIAEVTPYFADPTVGAVQIGVRINNRDRSLLARMQDIEFVVYTEVFQRGRRHLGSVGLGGNGQFVRLSALLSLGQAPWTRSLTDDLDLGVRLIATGWRNEYCNRVAVHQQGVVELRRLIRQRSRWFQGHLQSWKLVPLVLRRVPRRARTDLYYHLTSPAILLIASLLSASFVISLADCVVLAAQGRSPFGWWIASTYALTFGPALVYGCVYWSRERAEGVSLLRVAWYSHLYVCYGMMWYVSGWWAVGRTLRGRTGWAKTDRVAESPVLSPVSPGTFTGVAVPLPRRESEVAAASAATMPLPVVSAAAVAGRLPTDLTATIPFPVISVSATSVNPASSVSSASLADPASPASGVPGEAGSAPVVSGRVVSGVAISGPGGTPPEGEPEPPPPPRRRRRWAVITTAVAACAVLATTAAWPGVLSGRGSSPWLTAFDGYGYVSVTGSGAATQITLAPARTHKPEVTHAALVITKKWHGDFAATLRVRTLQQLREGKAGQPHPWEVAWVVWHYSSNQRFYALTLEQDAWVLSKQDPAYPGGERFLASGSTPRFRIGTWHSVGIVQIGNQLEVSADGHLLTRFTDTQRPYLNGAFGTYSEDAFAQFDHIQLHAVAGG
jgi:1,2-diacylglycerol 3-beta-glucosyltransferase